MVGRRQADIAGYIPWVRVVPDGRDETVITRAGGMLAVVKVVWPDLDTLSPARMVGHVDQLLGVASRFGDGWTLYFDLWRWPAPAYLPPSGFGGCEAAVLVDEDRRGRFEPDPAAVAAGAARAKAFRNTTFLGLHYLPPAGTALRARLYEEEMREGDGRLLQRFRHGLDAGLGELDAAARVERQRADQLASYLLATAAYREQPCLMPEGWLAPQLRPGAVWNAPGVALDARLEDGRLVGGVHLATVDVRTPGSPHPLTFQECYAFGFPLRWVTRFDCVSADRQPAVVEGKRRPLEGKKWRPLALARRIGGKMRGQEAQGGETKPEHEKAIKELEEYRRELAENPLAYVTTLVQVFADTREEAVENARLVASRLAVAGVVCDVTSLGRFRAYLSCIPGNVAEDRRYRRRVELPVRNGLKASPVFGTSPGHPRDWRFGGRALFRAETPSGVPYDFVLNMPGREVGHFVVIGQTGAGKSTLLALIALMFLAYEGARVVIFDKKRSSMVAVLCAGGVWVELAPGRPSVQPLRRVDDPADRGWAAGWLAAAVAAQGVEVTPDVTAAISEGLQALAAEPDPDRRTLTELWACMAASPEARKGLKPYLRDGDFGPFFDGVVRPYGKAPVLGIETDRLDALGRHAPLALGAVFWAVKRHWLAGPGPKLVNLDEAWAALREGSGAEREFQSGIREGRKGMTVYGMATQFVSDMDTDEARAIMAQVETRFYLPDGQAESEVFAEQYRRAGLTAHQIRRLKEARAKRDYLLQAVNGETRLLHLGLDGAALAICGASSTDDHERAWELLDQGAEPGDEFTRLWLAETTKVWKTRRGAPLRVAAE